MVGCEDGSVKLFEILPEKLQFERNLDRQKGRVLSLAWHKSGTMIATGSLDVIQVLDVKSGHCTRRIFVDRGEAVSHRRECVVWSLCFLSNYSIVSADSAGKIQFWDWQTETLLKTHPVTKCDVLTLSVNQRNLVCCSRKANLLLFQFPDQLELWRLGSPGSSGIPGDSLPISKKPEKLLQLKNKGCDHIRCCALSPCGTWIAFSNICRVRLYQVQYENDSVTIHAASRFLKVQQPAHQLLFSADSTKLFVALDHSHIQVVDLVMLNSKHGHILTPKSDSLEPVYLLAASADGNWLAAANYDCEINVYNLKQLKNHCTVPVYNHLPTAIAINPHTNNLIVVHTDHQIFEFSISEKKYTEWSRTLQQQGLHQHWLERDTPVTHVTFNPKLTTQIILHDTYMFCIIDQLLRLPNEQSNLHNQSILKRLSGKARKAEEHAFKICKKFKPLMHVELLFDGCLVVVERPVMEINMQLPAPVRQRKFAT
ncbi:hypothetical protein chiPu_0019194 [Chiloscyllium punctatum]|uniref:Anaphase-promoting complex subunit 4 WD40 domain-containing protein n=1 Tax=Chiloscyllium punctatum TaxID=137246 RepID=A0A401RRE2_CHIPU|nr:hypothetical protein [Chiloscyllium punctatum]